MYHYGLIGNCQVAALVSLYGSLDWLCMPRPDDPPIFGRILDEKEGGHFSIAPVGNFSSRQFYLPNTNILVTHFSCEDGSEFQITDFCPRFYQFGRIFRPLNLFRIVEPIKGSPTIKVSCRPINGWEKKPVKFQQRNSHLNFDIGSNFLRLTASMPMTYLWEETPFILNESNYFALTFNSTMEDDLKKVSNLFLQETMAYWIRWVKHCSIPVLYQKETIRSALALKLHCYEDTGAILAAVTTSLPEEPHLARNWDYRFCWPRDAAFALSAFHNLGHFEEIEGFLKFLLNVANKYEHSRDRLRPVYRLDQSLPLPEIQHPHWKGHEGARPVRSNNQAAEHIQNDVYGEIILALAPIFFDERFQHLRNKEHQELLFFLGEMCTRTISTPDAGLWEFRKGPQEHSFSNLMNWAGIDRLLRIHEKGYLQTLDLNKFQKAKEQAEKALNSAIVNGSLRNGPQDNSFDASLLLLPLVHFPNQELCQKSVMDIYENLRLSPEAPSRSFLYRYLRKDDFGVPKSAFLVCSFWLVQALVRIGEKSKATQVMEDIVTSSNHLGLLPEHFLPNEKKQCGNFPQGYSHIGLINAAFALSPPWSEIL